MESRLAATEVAGLSAPAERIQQSAESEASPAIAEPSPEPGLEKAPPPTGVGDDDAPFWPDETAEVAFLSEAKSRGEPSLVASKSEPVEELETRSALPTLDEMVKRIPNDVRETLEELFRAKFVSVKRVPKKSLKS